jgi:hypothetical protein
MRRLCLTALVLMMPIYCQSICSADPPLNAPLKNTVLICGDNEFKFGPHGEVDVFLNGDESDWSTDSKHIGYTHRRIVITPSGAQDSLDIEYKFGNYFFEDNQCELD